MTKETIKELEDTIKKYNLDISPEKLGEMEGLNKVYSIILSAIQNAHTKPSQDTINMIKSLSDKMDEIVKIDSGVHSAVNSDIQKLKSLILEVQSHLTRQDDKTNDIVEKVKEIRDYQKEQNGRVFKNSDKIIELEKSDIGIMRSLDGILEEVKNINSDKKNSIDHWRDFWFHILFWSVTGTILGFISLVTWFVGYYLTSKGLI